jgi:aminopeptidase N
MRLPFVFLFLVFNSVIFGQYSSADSLRGGYGAGRDWWDLTHYKLSVDFDFNLHTLYGTNEMSFTVTQSSEDKILQIDLQQPMELDSVVLYSQNKRLIDLPLSTSKKVGAAYLFPINLGRTIKLNEQFTTKIYFHGIPRTAKNAPWDGGAIWSKDENGKSWFTIACQGLGSSVWFPCKDTQQDEVDSVEMNYYCPADLVCVSNGKLSQKKEINDSKTLYTWKVNNPINNYCMIPYIGDYVHFSEIYQGEKGPLSMDYWVLNGNEEKAKKHFVDAGRTLKALEYWFGPYPFYEDGYKLVESPHLGMEHQSAIAYGNKYKKGYLGSDLSGTGVGLKWDFIIIHESGHEWYGNNITTKDIADMWVHESFTTYSETLFTDYFYGTEAANAYCRGLRRSIKNDKPIIGQYGVNKEGSGDMYYKGANLLHTIRTIVSNDTIFRSMLREMNAVFYHKTVTSKEIETFMSEKLNMNLKPIFDQYLRVKHPPTLQIKQKKNETKVRWIKCNKDFEMMLVTDHIPYLINTKWGTIPPDLTFDKNQYYFVKGKRK